MSFSERGELGEYRRMDVLYYRTTVHENEDVLIKDSMDWPGGFIRPKRELSTGMPVNTLYKRKADKVHPANVPLSDGSVPEGHSG